MQKLRFVPLGGIVGVTKNMYLYENWEDNILKDIVIVDCGIGFPEEKDLGVDLVIPDISYLKDKLHLIRALFVTHGHEDHISAIPYHYNALGKPKIYASRLTYFFIKKKCEETGVTPDIEEVDYKKEYNAGPFTLQYVPTTHSIPDTCNILIKTPVGNFYHGSDFKMDLTPPFGMRPDFYKMAKAGADGLLTLMTDCLGAEREGMTASESVIGETFEQEIRSTQGAFIMTTFSSNISRIRQCAEAAIKYGRKICFFGRSMRENVKIAQEINYFPNNEKFFVDEKQLSRIPRHKLCIILAGSQGQYGSALFKLVLGQNKFFKIAHGDKVLFSSDPIPGNEHEVDSMIEECMLQGADVAHSGSTSDIHTSGHGNQDDLKWLVALTRPKYIVPIGGTVRHQRAYADLVKSMGYGTDRVLMKQEGQTIEFYGGNAYSGDTIETKTIYVDGGNAGDVGPTVLNERETLSKEGLLAIAMVMDKEHKLMTKPRIITKGFVFAPQEKDLMQGILSVVDNNLKPFIAKPFNEGEFKKNTIRQLTNYTMEKRGRNPLVTIEIMYL